MGSCRSFISVNVPGVGLFLWATKGWHIQSETVNINSGIIRFAQVYWGP